MTQSHLHPRLFVPLLFCFVLLCCVMFDCAIVLDTFWVALRSGSRKNISDLWSHTVALPSSAGAKCATPSSNGAVARGTPSPPVGATDEVSPEGFCLRQVLPSLASLLTPRAAVG